MGELMDAEWKEEKVRLDEPVLGSLKQVGFQKGHIGIKTEGHQVTRLQPGGQAQRYGVEIGDMIYGVNGLKVTEDTPVNPLTYAAAWKREANSEFQKTNPPPEEMKPGQKYTGMTAFEKRSKQRISKNQPPTRGDEAGSEIHGYDRL